MIQMKHYQLTTCIQYFIKYANMFLALILKSIEVCVSYLFWKEIKKNEKKENCIAI